MAHAELPQPIAILGTGCRFPGGANNPSKLWELLKKPRDLLKEIPPDRFQWEGVYRPDGLHGSINTKHGYFLEENIRLFDPQFFNISPADAENIDPQQRLLLETVYEAIESAGLCLEHLKGTDTGVFVGQMVNDYYESANQDVDSCPGQILTTGTARSIMANRISYSFDFRGPSICVDTACSSSMMAVHLAVASLRRGESKIAFACGVQLNLMPSAFKASKRMNMTSSDGRSKMFDESADGYGRGEGAGVVCLKTLDAALEDGDFIECIIRETGTNQDGRTRGITMPSAEAQADLIRRTYQSIGLDPSQPGSRPCFFEAHGTGTPAGDPLEAQAAEMAFFPPGRVYGENELLYISSIKTVIGHTEGAAGIAGLLRASLAVRHGVIPPNLLFSRMNAEVQPYTRYLYLPTAYHPWPKLLQGRPRRASVNSFGFGGSNVHAIIESYVPQSKGWTNSISSVSSEEAPLFTPYVFSGVSESALTSALEQYLGHLESHKNQIRLQDLAWTLQYKRSQFVFRHAVPACGLGELTRKLQSIVQKANGNQHSGVYTKASQMSTSTQPRIMGIFTGQGAQWATMGKDLIDRSPFADTVITKLDAALATLPPSERPRWKLKEELIVESRRSRINEASLSQPLTTAIQIILVDVIATAGLRLHCVVGHSSGEIAAAYATGLITAEDAIRVAYLKGMHSKHAQGVAGQKGGMLVTALTVGKATELCCLPQFQGRLVIAAINSPSSVTLSGDSDAVTEASWKLGYADIFARKLQVDKAYHSHHMKPCEAPYLQSLERLNMGTPRLCSQSPLWFSSTFSGQTMGGVNDLKPSYWIENLMRPVDFSAAVRAAISETGMPDLFIELGPHPALEKPVRQITSDLTSSDIKYAGLLSRGINAVSSLSETLGVVWTMFGRDAVKLATLDKFLASKSHVQPVQLKNLPNYPWRHDKEYWFENRFLRKRYQAKNPPIELLGEEWAIGASHEAKWRCFLDPVEVPWLLEHKLNDVAVLAAAAYIVMASTAAVRLFRDQIIQMVDIENLRFELPIIFPDEVTKVEVVLGIVQICRFATHAVADFFVDFCSNPRNDELMTAVRGKLVVRFGSDADRIHPESPSLPSDLVKIDCGLFYDTLSETGFQYSGPFKCVESLWRRMDFAKGHIRAARSDLLIHPGVIDGLFQGIFATEGFPGDSAMMSFRVPHSVRSIKIFPIRCNEVLALKAVTTNNTHVRVQFERDESHQSVSDQTITASPHAFTPPLETMHFEVMRTAFAEYAGVLRSSSGSGTICQVEGLTTAPFRMSTPEDDVTMFREIVWQPYLPYQMLTTGLSQPVSELDQDLSIACERLSLYFLRQLSEDVTTKEEECAPAAMRHLIEYARLSLAEIFLGVHSDLKLNWLEDDKTTIADLINRFPNSIDIKVIELMGRAFPSMISGEKSAIGILVESGYLSSLYRDSLGFPGANSLLVDFVETLTASFPKVRILEVGAGTGAVTEQILPRASFSSYDFTDISSVFVSRAQENFRKYEDRMNFKTYDMEKEPEDQGYKSESYELVIASNVLHASADVKSVLRRLRNLLRPGGHLICMELSARNTLRPTVIFGALPGWWLGHGEDRFWSPALSEEQWHRYLCETGFAGLDAITPYSDEIASPYRVFYSQAVDERTVALRKPLTCQTLKGNDDLLILDSESADFTVAQKIKTLLSPSFAEIRIVRSLEDLDSATPIPYAVLSLLEMNYPVFSAMTSKRWSGLQRLLLEATDILWVTRGATSPTNIDDSFMSMMPGLGRALRIELPHLRLSFFDVERQASISAQCLAQEMLRWYNLGQLAAEGLLGEILYPQLTELAVKDDVILVPIVRNSKTKHDRYNSQHRRIFQDVSAHESSVELAFERSLSRYILRRVPKAPGQSTWETTKLVRMLYTTLYAFKIKKTGYLFLGLGVHEDESKVVTLSDATCSFLRVTDNGIYPCNTTERSAKDFLHAIAAHFIAERVLGAARSEGAIVVICSDPLWMSCLQARTEARQHQVVFVTSQPNFEQSRATFLHHDSMDLIIRDRIPTDISLLVNLSTRQDDEVLFERVSSVLSRSRTKMMSNDAFLTKKSTGYERIRALAKCRAIAERCIAKVEGSTFLADHVTEAPSITPKEATLGPRYPPSTIIDWTVADPLPVSILPATKDIIFSPEKTYLFVGSSEIAQSICEWMTAAGARYFMVTSRDPSRLIDWADNMSTKKAIVDITEMDVCNDESVRKVISSIRAGRTVRGVVLPPIGGVIHLGLVLRDGAFSNMSFEDLQAVTNVKAAGSLNLHVQLKGEKLDFFVLVSSIAYVLGQPGQSNYAAGNAFMVGLAKYRRSQGLAASVVHLGRVTGIGYILRNADNKSLALNTPQMRRKGVYPISERDLHEIFAEAILASPADFETGPEIITGIRNVEPDMLETCHWAKFPMFAHLVTRSTSASQAKAQPTITVRQKLNEAVAAPSSSTSNNIDTILKTAFLDKLRKLLQLDLIDEEKSLLALGIDSLVAAEIGSWARKELRVQIPNSVIFGGASVKDLVAVSVLGWTGGG